MLVLAALLALAFLAAAAPLAIVSRLFGKLVEAFVRWLTARGK